MSETQWTQHEAQAMPAPILLPTGEEFPAELMDERFGGVELRVAASFHLEVGDTLRLSYYGRAARAHVQNIKDDGDWQVAELGWKA